MAGSLQQKISDSVKTGAALVASYDEIIAVAKNPNGPVVLVDIDVPLAVAGLEQLAGVIAGGSISATVPKSLLPSGVISLQSVRFTLFTQTKTIGEISCIVAFGPGGQGLTWNITKIGSAQLSVTLDSLLLKWITPGTPAQFISALGSGSTTLGSLTLDVAVSYPQPTISFTQAGSAYVNLGDFFQQLGLPSVAFLHDLLMAEFALTFAFSQSTVSLSTQVDADGDTGVTLIPAVGSGPAILAFEQMGFNFTSAGGEVEAGIRGELLVFGNLALGVEAARNSDGSWSFSGNIDIPATWNRLHPSAPPSEPLVVTVADFAAIFAPGSSPPDALKTFGIAALSVDYSYSSSSSRTYALDGVFAGNWSVGSGLTAQVEIALGTAGNKLSAEFDLEGVSFELGYTFGNAPKLIDAKIEAGDVLSLSGAYNLDTDLVTLKFDKALQFDKLIAWFIREVTGNRYFSLPDPWDEVLSAIELPEGLEFRIDTKVKSIDCQYPLKSPISFLGFTLKGVEIGYDPSKKASGQSGLTVKIDSDLPDWVTIGEWDPGTQQPPKVPGSSAALLDIKLLGAGQHIGFNTPPNTVEQAVTELAAALDPKNWTSGLYPQTAMSFNKDIGWLLGSEVMLLGQVDIKFIFNDPTVYGLSLIVTQGKSDALNVLAGLSAEIIYRKVSDTVGVYEGTLTLPADIRKIDLNQVIITLPQLALSIYTNGDFKIDVGFPYNRDFSRSCSVVAAEYAGAGGFYYAKLDGLDPSTLPQIDTNKGVFSPVTEIGIGFEIGVTKGFSAGPLSASVSVMLQGIFQGTFAKYTRYADNAQDEYFAVQATVAIVGHLVGRLDFVIITASLEVTVYIELDLTIEAYRQAVAQVQVGVSVELTVTINCGLFKIHIHCGYSTTLSTQASFGQNGHGLWDSALAAPHLALAAAATAPPTVGWQPITDTNPLTVYFVPQLTAGLSYPQSDGKNYWYYVGQLGLSNPAAGATAGVKLANQDSSYAHFVRGMLRWSLYAFGNQGSLQPVDAGTANAKQISCGDVTQLLAALSDPASGVQPLISDVQAQFKASFQTTISGPDASAGADFGVGFFPAVPGMVVTLQADANAPVMRTPAMLSDAHLQAARHGGPAEAPHTLFLGRLGAPATSASATLQSVSERMMIDFAVLAIRSGLQKILDGGLVPKTGTVSIGSALSALQDNVLGAISGMTTRFMLHGTRQLNEGSDDLEPLYALTGQQVRLTDAELKAANLTMSLAFTSGAPADWGITFAGGGTSLSLSSSDKNQVVFKPSQIPEAPSFVPSDVHSDPMPIADKRPARFYLKTGIEEDGGPGLWQLPQALADHLARSAGNEDFAAYYLASPSDKPAPTTAAFVFSIDFRVRRIPADDGSGGYLANTYELFDVDQGSITSLQTLVTEIAAKQSPITALAIAYAAAATTSGPGTTARKAVITPIDFSRTFIVQSNFSTETRPPPSLLAAVRATATEPTTIALFLTKLWTAGITNSGGYYLFDAPPAGHQGLPDSLFDSGGLATLTLIADLSLSNGANPVALAPYVTGLRTPDHPVGGPGALYIASDQLEAVSAVLPAGHVGVDVSCKVPDPPGNTGSYGNSLNWLYNLITAESVSVGGTVVTQVGLPPVFGPVDREGSDNGGRWHYRHVFPLVAAFPDSPPPSPPPAFNPYASIGKTTAFELLWTDIFGNEWGPVQPSVSTALKYTDPLITLSQLPYLTLDYIFDNPNQAAQLEIGFTFTAPVYDVKDRTRRKSDIATYAQAYYQLVDLADGNQVNATVTTSLVTSSGTSVAIPVDVATIRDNIAKIYNALVLAPVGPSQIAVRRLTLTPITVAIPPSSTQLNAALVFPLTTTLTVTRTGPIDDHFPTDGPVKTVAITVSPRTGGSASDSHSLSAFAQAFETAFAEQNLVLAVGSNEAEGLTGTNHQIWVLRYGTSGISINMKSANPAYFAPRPLDNVLRARSKVSVRALNNDGTLGTASNIAVADIDIDAQMQKFLTAVDLMFSATDAIPTALINTTAINDLSTQKKAIVEKLVGYVTNLQTGESYDKGTDGPNEPITAAADRYRQECLIRMGAFYDMNAAAVPTVIASFGGGADPGLALFGHPAQTADPTTQGEKEFTLTSGKVPLATTARPMAIGLFAKNAAAYSQYVGNPSFVIDAIEHDIEPITVDNTTYEVGSWLKFINPRPALTIPSLAIPIALRAFPQPPQLIRQYALELIDDPYAPTTTDANLQLKLAKSWSLNGSYQHTYAAQDTVHLDVHVNTGLSGPAFVHATLTKDLLDTLVEFNQLYPQLQTLFTANKLSSIRTPEQAQQATILKNALQSFATLVDDVAKCSWTIRTAPQRLMAVRGDGLVERETRYAIQDGYGVKRPTDVWRSAVTFAQDVSQPIGIIPELQIDGYRTVVDQQSTTSVIYKYAVPTVPGGFLDAATASQIPTRSVAVMPPYGSTPFAPLDIVDRQNGLLSMMIGRNENLPPSFRYQTPWVTYTETISPTLDTSARINVAGIGQAGGQPVKRSLVAHLTALFTALVTGSGEPQPVAGSFQAVAYFAYPPTTPGSGYATLDPIALPITLRLPTDIKYDAPISSTPFYVTAIADMITDWLNANGLSASERPDLWPRSELRFDISLFSNASQTGRPILRLRRLFIDCREIS